MLLVLLGFYVFVGRPRSRTHQTFTLFVGSLALWTVKDIVVWGFGAQEGSAAWWAAASFIIALTLQYSLSVFAWVFPEDQPIHRARAAVLFAPGLVFVPAIMAGLMWREVRFEAGRLSLQLTVLAYVFGLYVYGLFIYGFTVLWTKYRHYRGTLKGQQLGAILWALVITVTLMTLANVVLPLAGVYSLLPGSSIFVLPGVLIYAYAISSFRLFSLQSALDQFRLFPIAYKVALSIAFVAIASFVLLQVPIVWWTFGAGASIDTWKHYLVYSVITALGPNLILVALVIRTISRPLREVTAAAVEVAGGKYGAQVALESNDEVGLLADSFNEMSRKMAEDIERLRQLNEQLIRAEKLAATGKLAAGVAHEVNNPLASISSLIQILQKRTDTDADTREMLRLISSQIARISLVLKDMMDFARVRPSSRVSIDINRIVETSIRLASFDAGFSKLEVHTSFDNELPPVHADPDQIQQVFLNLLLNARDAMPEGGQLTVSTRSDKETSAVLVGFEDMGSGIAREDLPHVFDPFFTTKPAGSGIGLGLAVCYGIITAHGGQISVKSNNGRGTRVDISLPVEQQRLDVGGLEVRQGKGRLEEFSDDK
jgi:signal transduction histidine kinase